MSEYIVRMPPSMPYEIRVELNAWYVESEPIVRCRDCSHSRKDGTLCMFFASWEPIAGGDEYAEIPADVEPDGFCAWGEKRGDAE